ncbi:MoxR family ATPase [Permianibacter sp. IMCC34836]|uniref:AAA family ATPase n=1 Tax=Permianibacter fluminis TaxID=2738515 RepID=UPI0015557E93|nr:MoxR family ATPase [Permianibacter fluminis]NQD38559.1 MoxR family ATPase [Permianibacter fluminis]
MSTQWTESQLAELNGQIASLREMLARVIVGQQDVVEQLLVALLAGGHALIEGVPGLGKTLLVKTLSEAMTLDFRRIQFTPDLMPSDIIGTELLEEEHGSGKRFFRFQKGPIFTQILLADEINRTPPKTQSALLEAMQEKSVTFAGEQHALPKPFFVLATQNPIEQAGTYPLPEAQLDRFLLHIEVNYPGEEEELAIVSRTTAADGQGTTAVMSAETLLTLQKLTREMVVSERLLLHATRLIRATRPQLSELKIVREFVSWGAGPRAAQALVLCAKARAVLQGRLAITREDIAAMLPSVLRHRVILGFQAEADNVRLADVLTALQALPLPN